MKTIFDHNPKVHELKDLFGYDPDRQTMAYGFSIVSLPLSDYDSLPEEEKLLDLAQLFELRGDNASAKAIWEQIPDIERQYRGGFDYVQERG